MQKQKPKSSPVPVNQKFEQDFHTQRVKYGRRGFQVALAMLFPYGNATD